VEIVEIVEIAAGLQIGGGGFAGDAVAIMPVITLLMLSVLCQQIKLCTVRAQRRGPQCAIPHCHCGRQLPQAIAVAILLKI